MIWPIRGAIRHGISISPSIMACLNRGWPRQLSSARTLNIPHGDLHRRRRLLDWHMSKMKPKDIKAILVQYDGDEEKDLNPTHFAQISALLSRHPLVSHILKGYQTPSAIRVIKHPAFNTLCFAAVLPDKSTCIFSYQLCLRGSTTSSLWRIFTDACRQTLFEVGLIDQVKLVAHDFTITHPDKQISVQFNRVFQDFSLHHGLVLERPEQLLRVVDRDDMMRWRLSNDTLRGKLIAFFKGVLLSPTPEVFEIIPAAGSQKARYPKAASPDLDDHLLT
uniref:Uncharacterized protein n=1 Tax=Spongospora subterranea TaxID=70186 RepID=A0A0H5R7M1_9EUKA|eukprot:CRZ09747.1 hypothetical protein [Spongospora subterranea]